MGMSEFHGATDEAESIAAIHPRSTSASRSSTQPTYPAGVAAGDRYPDMSTVNR